MKTFECKKTGEEHDFHVLTFSFQNLLIHTLIWLGGHGYCPGHGEFSVGKAEVVDHYNEAIG